IGPPFTDGAAGTPGAAGRGIQAATVNASGRLVLTYTDGVTADLGSVIGPAGPAFATYSAEVVSKADCTFSVTLPAGRFTAVPVATATARKAGGRDYVVTLTTVSTTTIAGQVRASRTLPAVIGLLSALVGYDTFACTATDLTPVSIHALPAAP
ncbi:hypothetical protein, partial [Methylobacterium dankookense]|uniref:hypothetical protein n=1 Tax=Methylobacterium dankookense TaxID=560405 RepID=UPI001EE04D28